jgi:hypothetical protein
LHGDSNTAPFLDERNPSRMVAQIKQKEDRFVNPGVATGWNGSSIPGLFCTRSGRRREIVARSSRPSFFKSPKTKHEPLPPASIITGSAITIAAASHPGLTFSARVGD